MPAEKETEPGPPAAARSRARPELKSSKAARATARNKDVLSMFSRMLGSDEDGEVTPVLYRKCLAIREATSRFLKVLALFRESEALALFPPQKADLTAYSNALAEQTAASFQELDLAGWVTTGAPTLADAAPLVGLDALPADVARLWKAGFAAAKKCNPVNIAIVTCRNLLPHKKHLEDAKALGDRFLTHAAGLTLAPLPDLPSLNFRAIYGDARMTPARKTLVLTILHKLYELGHRVYEAVSLPDLDPEEFAQVVMESIGEVRKQIPRCEQAFQKIEASVSLLKTNFGSYYKDYAESSNASIIMENYIIDVSKSTDASPAITAQFRKIVAHYKKISAQGATDPRLQGIFSQIDKNFRSLDRSPDEADDVDKVDSADSDSEAEPPETGSAAAPEGGAPGDGSARAARNRRKKEKAKAKSRSEKAALPLEPGVRPQEGAAAGPPLPGPPAVPLPSGPPAVATHACCVRAPGQSARAVPPLEAFSPCAMPTAAARPCGPSSAQPALRPAELREADARRGPTPAGLRLSRATVVPGRGEAAEAVAVAAKE